MPHDNVIQHVFYSKVANSWRTMYIYTPPGCFANPRRRYLVLYLLRVAGEDEAEWTHADRAQYILDNPITDGNAVPMIIVMNNGFVRTPDAPPANGRMQIAGGDAPFEEMLVNEVIPDVDANFRTLAGREHRALADLSMGGLQTFQIGSKHLDLFSHLGMFSGPLMAASQAQVDAVVTQGAEFNKKVPVIWFGAGAAEERFLKIAQDVPGEAALPQAGWASLGTQEEGSQKVACRVELCFLTEKRR